VRAWLCPCAQNAAELQPCRPVSLNHGRSWPQFVRGEVAAQIADPGPEIPRRFRNPTAPWRSGNRPLFWSNGPVRETVEDAPQSPLVCTGTPSHPRHRPFLREPQAFFAKATGVFCESHRRFLRKRSVQRRGLHGVRRSETRKDDGQFVTGPHFASFVGGVVWQRVPWHRWTCFRHIRRSTVARVRWSRSDDWRGREKRRRNGGCYGARCRCGRGWRRRGAACECQDCRYPEKPPHGRLLGLP